MTDDLISRSALLAEYDQAHVGKPGGARKLIEEAPAVDAVSRSALLAELKKAMADEWERRAVPKSGACELLKALEIVRNAPAVDAAPVRHGCEFCKGNGNAFMLTENAVMRIGTFGESRTLEIMCNYCPPYAQCSMKGVRIIQTFRIKHCPNCGAKLDGKKGET